MKVEKNNRYNPFQYVRYFEDEGTHCFRRLLVVLCSRNWSLNSCAVPCLTRLLNSRMLSSSRLPSIVGRCIRPSVQPQQKYHYTRNTAHGTEEEIQEGKFFLPSIRGVERQYFRPDINLSWSRKKTRSISPTKA